MVPDEFLVRLRPSGMLRGLLSVQQKGKEKLVPDATDGRYPSEHDGSGFSFVGVWMRTHVARSWGSNGFRHENVRVSSRKPVRMIERRPE